jgi:hypothetical protein
MITPLQRFVEIVTANKVMTERMTEFMEATIRQVNQNTMEDGSGSPEGVVTAEPNKLYRNTAAGPGSNIYVKKTGAGNTGWELV